MRWGGKLRSVGWKKGKGWRFISDSLRKGDRRKGEGGISRRRGVNNWRHMLIKNGWERAKGPVQKTGNAPGQEGKTNHPEDMGENQKSFAKD